MSKSQEKKTKGKKRNNGEVKVTRRTVLKTGAAAGALTVLTSRKSSILASPPPPSPPAEPVLCGTVAPASPPTTPFVDNLPIPFPAFPSFLSPAPTKAANIGGGEAARADHQRWTEFLPDITYRLEAKSSLHTHHRDYSPTYMWTFNGVYPAPTILNAYGHPTLVRFKNSLPVATTSFGRNETTIHLHNGHTGSESDGFAGDFFGTGLFKDNHYANAYAGIDEFGGNGDQREAMHTFWYHDHRAAFTANNNYLGMNGMYIVYDNKDPGHEFNTPGSLRLPNYYGLTDLPLELTDKRFCATANGRTEAFQVVGAGAPGGDKWVVNGKIQPKLGVRRRKYRFRILNTGPAKQWNLSLIKPDGTQATWTIVAADANFLHNPWVLNNAPLQVNVASRYDVIIDFAQFPVGTSVYLKEITVQNVGVPTPDPAPGLPIGNVVMRFDVVGNTIIPDTPPIPATLVDLPPIPTPDASFEWRFTLEPGNPTGHNFLINGLPFDANRVDHVIMKGTAEEWTLRNNVLAGNWLHPVHIHFEEGRVMERTTRPDPVGQPNLNVPVPLLPDEDPNNARRDVYPLPGQHSVRLRMKFRDFVGRYLIHCHNMNHEDDFMMVRWDIVDSVSQLERGRRDIAERRKAAGVPVEDGLPKTKEVLG